MQDLLKSLKGMRTKIEKTNEKMDNNQSEVINEMKNIGTRIDNLKKQVNTDRQTAKDNLENYKTENKKVSHSHKMPEKKNEEPKQNKPQRGKISKPRDKGLIIF